jgi:hypothetical protein
MQLYPRLMTLITLCPAQVVDQGGDATLVKIIDLIALCPAQVVDQGGDATLVKIIDSDYSLSSSGCRTGG